MILNLIQLPSTEVLVLQCKFTEVKYSWTSVFSLDDDLIPSSVIQ